MGIVAVGVAALIGVPLGILAAMATRWFGEVLMRGTDLLLAFPALLLAIMFSAVYGGSTLVAMIAIGIATVPAFARLIRSGALQVMRTEYVLAARAAGRRPVAIGVRHVLPNVGSLVIVQASVSFAIAVLAEAALSFLGFGTPPPTPSWGRMLQESQELLFSAPRLALFPGLAIAVAVLGFNLLGDGLARLPRPQAGGPPMTAVTDPSTTHSEGASRQRDDLVLDVRDLAVRVGDTHPRRRTSPSASAVASGSASSGSPARASR